MQSTKNNDNQEGYEDFHLKKEQNVSTEIVAISPHLEFQNILEEMVLHILRYLEINDVVHVAKTCTRLNWIVKRSTDPWKKVSLKNTLHSWREL